MIQSNGGTKVGNIGRIRMMISPFFLSQSFSLDFLNDVYLFCWKIMGHSIV